MKFTLPKLAALALLLGCTSAYSQTLNWGSLIGSEIVNSDGQEIDSDGVGLQNAFLFQLGAFQDGFIPDDTNVSQWLDNWHVYDSASLFNNGDGTSQFLGSKDVHDYRNPGDSQLNDYPSVFEGLKGYIWVRNTAGTEYFLASAGTWTFPTLQECCPSGGTVDWSVSDVIVPVWGSAGDNHGGGTYTGMGPYDIQTHSVPEVGSAFFALFACGMTVLRRRRPVAA
ncbi:MAG: hypothetical protein EOP84_10355 [Verrucomicrobiaceae bacterium]|nr:MAG: hypothetical protein EOP84_10355 [Verrucomicrobiaceae bacterium]